MNALRLPSTQCPLGLNKNGLPLGIQVVANKLVDLWIKVNNRIEKF